MREAAAKAGIWFFGSIIFMAFFLRSYFTNMSPLWAVAAMIGIALVIAGLVFSYGWYEFEEEERRHRLDERRRAVDEASDSTR